MGPGSSPTSLPCGRSEVSAIKNLDTGISSRYREVQGLDVHDVEFEAKNELMASIFEANLRLQGK